MYQGEEMTADEIEVDEGIVGRGSGPELEMIHRVESWWPSGTQAAIEVAS